jgi:hypothetical protein
MTRAAIAVYALFAATAFGCPGEASDRAPAPVAAGTNVVVTEDDHSLPRGCRPAEVAVLLEQLFGALNRGDRQAAAALVIDREMLALLSRPAHGRTLRLRAVIVGFANGLGQIEFRAAGRLEGKGAVDCKTRRLVAVGLGAERGRMSSC